MPTNKTILVVDDQPSLLYSIQLTLESANYNVLTALDGQIALQKMHTHQIDLVLADVAMPNLNGYQLYEKVRQNPEWVHIPFILLTARAMDTDIRFGKEMGVDDYLTKPCEPEDLLAAVRGCLRRTKQWKEQALLSSSPATDQQVTKPEQQIIRAGDVAILAGEYQAWVKGKPIKLSAREFELLAHLVQHKNHLVSPVELVKVTHDIQVNFSEASNLIRPFVRTLRRKLGFPVGEMGSIETVRGVGYRLLAP